MFVLDRLDATRIVSRASAPLADPAAWSRPAPVEPRRVAAVDAPPFSWRSLARNPNALVFTGMIGSVMARDAVLRLVFKH